MLKLLAAIPASLVSMCEPSDRQPAPGASATAATAGRGLPAGCRENDVRVGSTGIIRLAAGAASMSVAQVVPAAVCTWKRAESGLFSNSAKWLGGYAPTANDRACFDGTVAGYTPGLYNVTMPDSTGPIEVEALVVRTDKVTFNLRQQTFRVRNVLPTNDEPVLIVGSLPGHEAILTLKNTMAGIGTLEAGTAVIADQPTNGQITNQLRVHGGTVLLHLESDLHAGRRGKGELWVQDSGNAIIDGSTYVGTESGADGGVYVYQSSSKLRYGRDGARLVVGAAGEGVWTIGNTGNFAGASAESIGRLASVVLGDSPGGEGSASIRGTGSVWTLRTRSFYMGGSGGGSAIISDGGKLDSDTSSELYISRWPGAHGSVTVKGSGSTWIERTATIHVGDHGELRLLGGGSIRAGGIHVLPGGVLRGQGLLAVPPGGSSFAVSNSGLVSPDIENDDIGLLSINGDYAQTGATTGDVSDWGTLHVDLGGAAAADVDRLAVTGTANIAGNLEVALVNGFDPQPNGRSMVFLSANKLEGRFDAAVLPGFPPDADGRTRFMEVVYESEGPGPASAALVVRHLDDLIDLAGPPRGGMLGQPTNTEIADFDHYKDPDGNLTLDVAITFAHPTDPSNKPGTVLLLLNSGTRGGTWQGFCLPRVTLTVQNDPRGLAAGDFNRDSRMDLAVANAGSDSISLLINTGAPIPRFAHRTIPCGRQPVDIAAGDVDGANGADLVVLHAGDSSVTIHHNDGSGTFSPGAKLDSGQDPSTIVLAQMEGSADQDLDLDIVLVNRRDGTAMVYFNDGAAAAFPTPPVVLPTGPDPDSILPGDLDNDKDLDITILDDPQAADAPRHLSIIVNNGDNTFAPAVRVRLPSLPRPRP